MLALMREVAVHGYRCLAPNMRGYGRSVGDSEPTRFLVGDLAADVVALARSVSDEPVHVVGHDWGALASYGAANLAPETFASVTALAVPPMVTIRRNTLRNLGQLKHSWYIGYFQLPLLPEQELQRDDFQWIRDIWQAWSPHWELPSRRLDSVIKTLKQGDSLTNALAYYRSLTPLGPNVTFTAWLASWSLLFREIEVPGLVIAGEDDGCMKLNLFDGAEDAFAVEGELYRVAGAGHFMHLEKHSEVSSAILRWIESHPVNFA